MSDKNALDNPLILSMLFYPRPAQMGTSRVPKTQDGTIPVEDDIVLGYRLFQPEKPTRFILYFHGNGEVASDYDDIAPLFFRLGAALMVVDYRGYGWSTGKPLTSTLATDTDSVMKVLPEILQTAGLGDLPRFIFGRSLGSAPATYLAQEYGGSFKGLIIESGFADTPSVFKRLGIAVSLFRNTKMPIANAERMREVRLPLLVIHGENDQVLPVENGQQLFDASPVEDKRILRIPQAGHNDILYRGANVYFDAVGTFLDTYA